MHEELRALADGDLAAWPGLPGGLARADVEAALGAPPEAEGPLGLFGTAATLCRYPATAAAPLGIQIWYVAGAVELVQIDEPVPTQAVTEALGPPEADVDSLLGSSRRQLVYAGRGLTVHVSGITGEPYRLYGYPPCPAEQFLAAPLRYVSSTRSRR
ncbi:hypothetical protein [Paractinoplanes rishiriensis]|uniref:Uncharacterized protein n=1 Tax=Paractinoplanes rishiriensis TaxID=1050105 RepID=A0A919K6G3_9ACTN|nr:hypothetical protein [Actinoplanes rishiriensis]GIE99657.1 hypothetical protein Ari01nite_71220 [Actinoplanes rishiriensis]